MTTIDISKHERLVTFVLKKSRIIPKGIFDMEDYRQAGMIGLWIAAKKYDPSKGYKFSTYAIYWIRSEIHKMKNYELANKRQAKMLSTDVRINTKKGRGADNDLTLGDTIEDKTALEESVVENLQLKERILEAMRYEPFIVSRMVQGYSMAAIGREMGLTQQRIQQRVKSMREKVAR